MDQSYGGRILQNGLDGSVAEVDVTASGAEEHPFESGYLLDADRSGDEAEFLKTRLLTDRRAEHLIGCL